MQKWEYLVVRSISQDEMNELGAEGWELVAVVDHASMLHMYFKRLKF